MLSTQTEETVSGLKWEANISDSIMLISEEFNLIKQGATIKQINKDLQSNHTMMLALGPEPQESRLVQRRLLNVIP